MRDKYLPQIPQACNLITSTAHQILGEAGVDTLDLGPRHWVALRYFAKQEPAFFDDKDYDGPTPVLELDVGRVKPTYLKSMKQAGIIIKFRKRDPTDRRMTLWNAWLITPDMLETIKEALQALIEDNKGNYFFTESPGSHSERIFRSLRQTRNLRGRLMDLLAGQEDCRRSTYPKYLEGPMALEDPEELIGILGLKSLFEYCSQVAFTRHSAPQERARLNLSLAFPTQLHNIKMQ